MAVSISFGGGARPDPRKFQQPINSGPQTLPMGSGSGGLTPDQQSQMQNAMSAAGFGDWIANAGSAAWDFLSGLIDKAGGWEKIAKDIVGFIKDNKSAILDGLNVYNQYQRGQQSDKYAKQALDLANQRYDSQAPLRTAGMTGLMNPGQIGANTGAVTAQGQNGLQLAAPQPMRAPTLNLANAQTLATGGGANPFTKSLPQAPIGLPLGTAPSNPGAPMVPPPAPTPPATPTPPSVLGLAPTPAQLEGPHIPAPFSDIPAGYGQTRQPGQRIKPLPLATR